MKLEIHSGISDFKSIAYIHDLWTISISYRCILCRKKIVYNLQVSHRLWRHKDEPLLALLYSRLFCLVCLLSLNKTHFYHKVNMTTPLIRSLSTGSRNLQFWSWQSLSFFVTILDSIRMKVVFLKIWPCNTIRIYKQFWFKIPLKLKLE